MPGTPYPTKISRTRRTSAQRAANARGLLNLGPAIEAELARLNALKRFLNEGHQKANIVEQETKAQRDAIALLREIQEEERDELEKLRLSTQVLPVHALPVPLPPPKIYLGPHTVVPFTNLELSDSPIVLTPSTGGKRLTRNKRRRGKKTRKHLRK
jgi:hypothetical protein